MSKSWIRPGLQNDILARRAAEKEAQLFVNGARMAGLPACVPADKLKQMPNLIRVKSCDEERAKITG